MMFVFICNDDAKNTLSNCSLFSKCNRVNVKNRLLSIEFKANLSILAPFKININSQALHYGIF